MSNYSRNTFDKDTFNKLKNYVSVRLQQGVPLVDADWNEKDDIRRFEIEAFLKWFIGDGVPKGSDAFCIEPAANRIYLGAPASANPQRLLIEIDVDASTSSAAAGLGFGPDNFKMEAISPPAQLTGKVNNPSVNAGDQLRLRIGDPGPTNDWVTLAFNANLTGADLAKAIADALQGTTLKDKLAVGVGSPDDLVIKGGDGKGGVGLCLVEGWDVMTFGDEILPKQSLTGDKSVFYLDVWEQEIDSDDDPELTDGRIGIETCVRVKRVWVVRQAGITDPADYLKGIERKPGHVYYPLATLTEAGVLEDLRHTRLTILPPEITVSHGKVGIGTNQPQAKLEVAGGPLKVGSLQLDGFTGADQDEWPHVVWYQSYDWDEGLIKTSSQRGVFRRAGFGIHFHKSRQFGLWSTGWDPLFAVEGGTGNAYFKGNLEVTGTIYVGGDHLTFENNYEIYLRGSAWESSEGEITFLKIANNTVDMDKGRGLNTVILNSDGTFKNKNSHDVLLDASSWNDWADWVNTNASAGDIVAVATWDALKNAPRGGSAEKLLNDVGAFEAFSAEKGHERSPYALLFVKGNDAIEVSNRYKGPDAHIKTTYYQLLNLNKVRLKVNGQAQLDSVVIDSLKLSGFTGDDRDEWPNVVWYQSYDWDEGLIKTCSQRGVFGRAGFGIHFHKSRQFGLWSTGWDPLFAVEGESGNAYIKGNVGIGTSVWLKWGRLIIEDNSVPLVFRETDRDVDKGGLWRMPLDDGVLRFDVNTGAPGQEFGSNYITPLAMTKGGNVGIGTLNPKAKLDVDGYIAAKQVYFSAYLHDNEQSDNLDPLPMKVVSNNVGDCYSIETSKFTAPVKGVYLFTMTGLRVEGDGWLHWYLMVNGDYANKRGGVELEEKCGLSWWPEATVTSSRTIILPLSQGDIVHVQQIGTGRCDNYRSGLEGTLLYASSG